MNAPTEIKSAIDNLRSMEEMVFRFKKDKLGNQRPSVKVSAPVPTAEGIVSILTSGDEKQWGLIKEALYDMVRNALAGYVSEESFDPATFDSAKLNWEALANMEKTDRRSSTIPEELWTAFTADYISVMPAVTGKTAKQVENATEIFTRKMTPVKSNKPLIAKLKEQLALYTAQPSAEPYTEIIDFLVKRCDTYLAADDMAAVISNI
jgi:hypothetical protein